MSQAQQHITSRLIYQGFVQLLPISIFVIAFGLAFGLAATQHGLTNSAILAMSAFVFAGASQFATLDLWGAEIAIIPVMITVFAINARHLLMGASLHQHIAHLSVTKRYGAMMLVTDANWAMSLQAINNGKQGLGILIGGGIALWLCWLLGTWLGLYFGSAIKDPVSLGLDMVMACFLLSMVAGGKVDVKIIVIWSAAALSSLLAYWYLPPNSHVIVGALVGGFIGAFWLGKKA
ncbi:AzlC family ABC transporter permease [Reinekea marina]|uniref:AzlC family ABC transporter permease n=1 Tax=Reinekea marina TaxID=1310421 RepID=A0ABV7WQ48_9GAMM|nr:AzlC family ABC transporter permease [Reinekea marina]MDN3650350.1 AzlC family ABC transporter permease [Reinekea marina]